MIDGSTCMVGGLMDNIL